MTNVEKVIKGLRCLTGMPRCDTCPYSNNPQRQYCLNQIGKDAIKLLKEQEAVEPETGHWIEYEGTQGNYYDCSVCDCSLMEIHRGMKYCPYCGAKMDNPM